jgi:hypothetical protein
MLPPILELADEVVFSSPRTHNTMITMTVNIDPMSPA